MQISLDVCGHGVEQATRRQGGGGAASRGAVQGARYGCSAGRTTTIEAASGLTSVRERVTGRGEGREYVCPQLRRHWGCVAGVDLACAGAALPVRGRRRLCGLLSWERPLRFFWDRSTDQSSCCCILGRRGAMRSQEIGPGRVLFRV